MTGITVLRYPKSPTKTHAKYGTARIERGHTTSAKPSSARMGYRVPKASGHQSHTRLDARSDSQLRNFTLAMMPSQ